MHCPDDCLCNESHLWCREHEDGTYLVGISDYAQNSLGEIMFVELPDSGSEITKNQSFGIVESTKVVSELISPLGGTVVAINTAVEDAPDLLNSDPYGEGWLLQVRIGNTEDVADLMAGQEYLRHLAD